MTLAPGTRLGPYVIDIPVGAGGMGEVYRARDERLERDVAIKVLPAGVAGDPGRRARFEREAKAVAALSHPNILAIHDIGEGQSFLYAVTELLDGETLRDRLTHGPLPVRKAVDIAIQIARGLSAAHDKGLVHRDLKPENVFLLKDGQVKILDFGLARQSAETGLETSATRTVAAALRISRARYSRLRRRGQCDRRILAAASHKPAFADQPPGGRYAIDFFAAASTSAGVISTMVVVDAPPAWLTATTFVPNSGVAHSDTSWPC